MHDAAYRERNRWRNQSDEVKEALREKRWLKKYGLTAAQYWEMYERQMGCCAICGSSEKKRMAVDHCHKSGAVRGLLCVACNLGLGNFRDSPAYLSTAISYLKGYLL